MPKGMRRATERNVYLWDTGQGLTVEMVYVPPGDFIMGSEDGFFLEELQHTHHIPRGYYIGRYPTTVGEFRRFVEATRHRTTAEREGNALAYKDGRWQHVSGASWRNPGFSQADDHPVVCVSWEDAKAFCDWAGLALPSEPQWEKAARGTDGRTYPWGNEAPTRDRCWNEHTRTAERTDSVTARPRGASPYEALDMAGNISEWTADWYDSVAYRRYAHGDTTPPSSGSFRVSRGGGWLDSAWFVRSAKRRSLTHGFRYANVGFRPSRQGPN